MQEGETVLVLGATGVVGQIGVQAAKLLGAGKVIAAGRDPAKLAKIDADATVQLPATADDLREAAGGPIDVVLDPLWGEHAPVATEAMNVNGRLVILGQSAGQQATFDAGVVRGKALQILGHGNAVTPPEVKYSAFRAMCDHAAAGEPEDRIRRASARPDRRGLGAPGELPAREADPGSVGFRDRTLTKPPRRLSQCLKQ